MAALQAEQTWTKVFPKQHRPQLYSSATEDENGFRPLTEASEFMPEFDNLNPEQLYAICSNNSVALQLAQQEYIRLARQIAYLKDPEDDKPVKNPQALDSLEDWEDKKEATLYGQKYIAPKPVRKPMPGIPTTEIEMREVTQRPDLFTQGGFVPNERQKKRFLKLGTTINPDGFPLVEKDGKFYAPMQQTFHEEYVHKPVTKKPTLNTNGEQPNSADPEDPSTPRVNTPVPSAVDHLKRSTRYNGKKHPPTRDVSEAPSLTPKRKRLDTPDNVDTRESTPKRPKLGRTTSKATLPDATNGQPAKRKQPNQYTKAREREAAAAAGAVNGDLPPASTATTTKTDKATTTTPPTFPNWWSFTPLELLQRKFTDAELVDCVKTRDDWLGSDPVKVAKDKAQILNAKNPVRSWSMIKKWGEWADNGKAKRPRNKEKNVVNGTDGADEEDEEIERLIDKNIE